MSSILPVSSVAAIWAVEGALLTGIVTVLVFAFRPVSQRFADGTKAVVAGSLLASMNTASEYGFGAVIASLPGFLVIKDALKAIPNPNLRRPATARGGLLPPVIWALSGHGQRPTRGPCNLPNNSPTIGPYTDGPYAMTRDATGRESGEPSKAKVFISYSRKDMAFADRLEVALKARGFEPLIDRSEIYAFEDWWKRIETLITRADTVAFIWLGGVDGTRH